MKRLIYATLVGLVLLLPAVPAQAQTVLNTTTLSAAIDDTQTTFTVASTSNIAPTSSAAVWLFVPQSGELISVTKVPQSGVVQGRRSVSPTRPFPAPSGATVIIVTSPRAMIAYDLSGKCTRGSALAAYSPVINLTNGTVWVCRASLWQGTNSTLVTYNSLAPFTP